MIAKTLLTSISLAISITGAIAGLKSSGTNSSTIVTWDKYSLKIDDAREFIFSGEFHYYRLPSPDLWSDVFQKFKALGYNTASLYFFWGYHSARKGVYDFEGVRDVQKVLDDAKSAGIHVIARPGPYVRNMYASSGNNQHVLMLFSRSMLKSMQEVSLVGWKQSTPLPVNPPLPIPQLIRNG
ncbi:hypothetical protein INT43_003727 [Umbelopsis isabellina]|uniref:Glycoside hydrolase 35 catalytic domain-containing protein n=1 Tax=Mortierella isabellina TaxID=91625 RepID=A0A8H7PUF0_MORIS|nr:hypothetical protein INT43_003727 [Umbelopsis isabellina]